MSFAFSCCCAIVWPANYGSSTTTQLSSTNDKQMRCTCYRTAKVVRALVPETFCGTVDWRNPNRKSTPSTLLRHCMTDSTSDSTAAFQHPWAQFLPIPKHVCNTVLSWLYTSVTSCCLRLPKLPFTRLFTPRLVSVLANRRYAVIFDDCSEDEQAGTAIAAAKHGHHQRKSW